MIKLENSYLNLPETFYKKAIAAKIPSPELIAFNPSLAKEIGLDLSEKNDDELAQIFSGQILLPKSTPISLAYAGFQFGHPVPQLGDGRALLLGQSDGFDIQLKGSGPTPFSRNGDGKSALGPVIREYIVSEAMHHLGVPTTRALCAVTTGEDVFRQQGAEPGGIFTRVADSHLRVGTFQYFAFQNDIESIVTLLDYTIERHYPEFKDLPKDRKAIELLKSLTVKQAKLIAKWSGLGFIHGVMNTDNFSMAGITIDYGPCAFMEEFNFHKVFSSIDRQGRYSFFNQVPIAKWNLTRLAETLLPLIHSDQQTAIDEVEKSVLPLFSLFETKRIEQFALKLGITDPKETDEELVMQFLKYLEDNSLDFTLGFYQLPDLYRGDVSFYKSNEALENFVKVWKQRVAKIENVNLHNPLYIPRNHLVQKAITEAYQGDFEYFHKLNLILQKPFEKQQNAEEFETPAKPEEAVTKTFCGT